MGGGGVGVNECLTILRHTNWCVFLSNSNLLSRLSKKKVTFFKCISNTFFCFGKMKFHVLWKIKYKIK